VAIVLLALCLIPLLGIVGLSLEGGLMMENRRRGQATADAAALAAADDLYKNYQANQGLDTNGTARQSALDTAAANGYTNDGTNSVVTVNIPPLSGSFAGKPGYVEVLVQYDQQRAFSNLFGSGAMPVTARSVARGMWVAFNTGLLVLDPTSPGSLTSTGGGGVNITGGASIIVDSNNPAAAQGKGTGNLAAPEFDITGTPGTLTTGGGAFVGTIDSGVPPTPDPLRYLPQPDPSTMTVQSDHPLHIAGTNPVTLQPGVYKGGISISGQGSVTLMPGIYYMQGGGFSATGQGNLTGNGVMFFNAPQSNSDNINLAGLGSMNITPPTSGIYTGLTIFQDRNATIPLSVSGNGATSITGTFYAAKALLGVTGNGLQNVLGSQYISYDLTLGGNGGININWNAQGTARTRIIGLVE
jgi:Flp pilus assembly protein TadG